MASPPRHKRAPVERSRVIMRVRHRRRPKIRWPAKIASVPAWPIVALLALISFVCVSLSGLIRREVLSALFSLATVILTTAEPEVKTTGNWPFSTFDTGPVYRFVIAPTNASTNAQHTGGAFYALLAANDNGGIWFSSKQVQLYDASTGSLIAASGTMAFTAAMAITCTIRIAAGTNASSITVAGATSGNGTTTFTIGTHHIFTNVTLGVGIYGGGGFTWPGTIGDVDTAGDNLSATVASASATVPSQTLSGGAASIAGGVAQATATGRDAALDGGGVISAGVASASATVPSQTLSGGAASIAAGVAQASATSPALTITNTSLSVGVHGIAFQIYGHSNGPSTITINVTAGSMLLAFAGGLVGNNDVGANVTSDRSDVFKLLDQERVYADFGGLYSTAARVCHSAVGGVTTFSQPVTQFTESTFFIVEIKRGKIVRSLSWLQVANASGGPTLTSGNIVTTSSAVGVALWWGSGNVFTPPSTPFTAVPDKGTVIESYLVNNSDGEVQAAMDVIIISAPTLPATTVTTNVVWTHSPNQGGQALLLGIQDEEILPFASATATALTPIITPGGVNIAAGVAQASATAVTPGELVAITTQVASATASAVNAVVTGGPASVQGAGAAPASATALNATLAPGVASIAAGVAQATATGQSAVASPGPGAAPISAGVASGTGTGRDATMTGGGASVTSLPAQAAATAVSPTVLAGGNITPSVAQAVLTVLDPTLSPGAVQVTPLPAVATASARDATLAAGIEIAPQVASASASALDADLQNEGTQPLDADVATATATAINPTMQPGTVELAAGVATAVAVGTSPALSSGHPLPRVVTGRRTTAAITARRTTASITATRRSTS